MIIGFVRHGKTDWNGEGRIQGQTDIPLNREGVGQAQALADRLYEEKSIWDMVASSDLQRARRTAEIIADKLRIPLLDGDNRLRERSFGEAEGTLEAERMERWGQDWRNAAAGVESDERMLERGMAVLEQWRQAMPGKNILIVSHGSFIATMLKELCRDLKDERLSNLSYTILELQEGCWEPLLYNCTRHLVKS